MNTTVVIPLYNKGSLVARAITSVLTQTHPCREIIVVDDGSTDHGPDLVSQFSDPRIKLVKQANRGPGAARNLGLKMASQDYIAFLDADDEWLPTFLECAAEMFDFYASHEIACVSNAYNVHPFDGVKHRQALQNRGLPNGILRVGPGMCPSDLNRALSWLQVCATVSKTMVLRTLNGFHEGYRMGEDQWLFLKVLLNHPVCFVLDDPQVLVHTEASSLASRPHDPNYIPPLSAYLADPTSIETECPRDLRPLLRQLLALRAFSVATNWGRAGAWRDARLLIGPYISRRNCHLEGFWSALVHSTPLVFALRQLKRIVLRREYLPAPTHRLLLPHRRERP